MGRGVHAAAVMGQLRAATRAFAVLDLAPAEVLRHLDELVVALDAVQIVTCVYAVFDPSTSTLTVANAGHLPPLLLHDGRGAAARPRHRHPARHRRRALRPARRGAAPGRRRRALHRRTGRDTGQRPRRRHRAAAGGPHRPLAGRRHVHRRPARAARRRRRGVRRRRGDARAACHRRRARAAGPAAAGAGRGAAHGPRRRPYLAVRAGGSSAEVADNVALVVSELVTNAVLHTGSSPTLRLRTSTHAVYVEVTDDDSRQPRMRDPEDDEDSGRGLHLIEALSRRWNVRTTSQRQGRLGRNPLLAPSTSRTRRSCRMAVFVAHTSIDCANAFTLSEWWKETPRLRRPRRRPQPARPRPSA